MVLCIIALFTKNFWLLRILLPSGLVAGVIGYLLLKLAEKFIDDLFWKE